jgi:hypothetical protein
MFGVNTTYNKPSGILGPDGRPLSSRPGLDRDFPLSPSSQFAGVFGSGSGVLYNLFDQALLEDREDAVRRMENDPHITAPLQERTKAVESLQWEIECDEERDPIQKAMKDGITKVVRATSRMRKMIRYLHKKGTFKGRQGASVAFSGDKFRGGWGCPAGPAFMNLMDLKNPDGLERRKVPILRKHSPVDGDKIQWLQDGTPVVLGNTLDLDNIPGAELANTSLGRGLVIRGDEWSARYIIHQHEMEDADFFSPREAGKAFGVGLRDSLYWTWWLKNRWLGNITQFMQRFGLGVRAWLYEAGSDKARIQAEEAAASLDQDSVDIMVPVWKDGGQRAIEGIKFIDVGSGGTGVLRELIDYLDDSMERLIIGQTLSSDSEGSGLGGTGVAMLHASTKAKIIASDANDLGETFTTHWIRRLPVWIWGEEYRSLSDAFRFKFIVDQPNPTEALTAAATFVQLGGEVSEPALRRAAGIPEAKPGEKVISALTQAREQAQLQQELQQTPAGQPTPPVPGEEQQGPTPEDFEALLHGGEETEQFDRAGPAIRFARDQVAGAVERLRCHRECIPYARDDNALALGMPEPTAPVAIPGVKPRTQPGHTPVNPEFVNGKPHTSGEFSGKTPMKGVTPDAPAAPAIPSPPPVSAPAEPKLVQTYAKKFQAKYGPKSLDVLKQKAATAQGGIKLAAQALLKHFEETPGPEDFAEIMKGFGGTERHERRDLERYAEDPSKPPKAIAPPKAPAPSGARIDSAPPAFKGSNIKPKILGSSVLPKIINKDNPLNVRARGQAVDKLSAAQSQPRTPDLKTPAKLHADVAPHVQTLKLNAPGAKDFLDRKIAQYEQFAHESPLALKRWKGAQILKAALDHAETGQYDPKHLDEVRQKMQGMTVDPDMGPVPNASAPPGKPPGSTPVSAPAGDDDSSPPDWLHNGLFDEGVGTAQDNGKRPREPWEEDPEAWRGGEPARPAAASPTSEEDDDEEEDPSGSRIDPKKFDPFAEATAKEAGEKHFAPTTDKPAVAFTVNDDFAGELLAKDIEHHPPLDLPPKVSQQIAAELKSGETSPAKLFDDTYAMQRWGRTFGPANFPDLAKMFKGEKADEGGVDFDLDEEGGANPALNKPTQPGAGDVRPMAGEQSAIGPHTRTMLEAMNDAFLKNKEAKTGDERKSAVDEYRNIVKNLFPGGTPEEREMTFAINDIMSKQYINDQDPSTTIKQVEDFIASKPDMKKHFEDFDARAQEHLDNVASGTDWRPNEAIPEDYYAMLRGQKGDTPNTPAPATPFVPASETHAGIDAKMRGGMERLPEAKRAEYTRNAQAVVSRLNPHMARLVDDNVRSSTFHPTTSDLTKQLLAESPDLVQQIGPNGTIAGAYVSSTGHIHSDGDVAFDGGFASGERVLAHELGEAVNGRGRRFSQSPEWQSAWQKDIAAKHKMNVIGMLSATYPLTKYAAENEDEGFAEFFAYMHTPNDAGKLPSQAEAATEYPNATAFAVKNRMFPGGDGSHQKPYDVFEKPAVTDAVRGDTLLPEDRQFALALEDHVSMFPPAKSLEQHRKETQGQPYRGLPPVYTDKNNYYATINDKSGKYNFSASKDSQGVWDVGFGDQNGEIAITGAAGAGALRVMSAIGSATLSFIRDKAPKGVTFTSFDKNRSRIYGRFAKWVAEKAGYDLNVHEKYGSMTNFKLTRKPDPKVPDWTKRLQQKFGPKALDKVKETYDKLRAKATATPDDPEVMAQMMRLREVSRELKRAEIGLSAGPDVRMMALDLPKKSRAPLEVQRGYEKPVEVFVKKLLPNIDMEEIPSLVGAPDDAKTRVYMDSGNTMSALIEHPDAGWTAADGTEIDDPIDIQLKHTKYGNEPYLYLEWVGVKKNGRGKGMAGNMIGSMIENAQKAGIKSIRCHAAKNNPRNPQEPHSGYYVWPGMGFDTDILTVHNEAGPQKTQEMKRNWPEAQSLSDIINTTDGYAWWKKNGVDLYDTRFDTTPGSKSMKMWEKYQSILKAKRGGS